MIVFWYFIQDHIEIKITGYDMPTRTKLIQIENDYLWAFQVTLMLKIKNKHMKKGFTLIILFGFSFAGIVSDNKAQCQNSDSLIVAALAMISHDSMQNNVEDLQEMGTRFLISPNHKEVATWIMNKFISYGIEEVRLDSFPCNSYISWPPFLVYDTTTWQYNVEARIEGNSIPEEEIVLIGHYDCVVQDADPMVIAPGADDNASGTAATMECARVMMEMGYQPEQTLIFLASAAEELMYYGDAGTEHYAAEAQAEGRDITMAINNDMIAWNDGSWTIDLFNSTLSPLITSMAIYIIENYTTLNIYSWQPVYEVGGDIQPFLDAGYQGIYFMEHLINPNYHTINDIADNCDFQYLAEATKVSLGLILHADLTVGTNQHNIIQNSLNILPNPSALTIHFVLDVTDQNTIYSIFNLNGDKVETGRLIPGNYHDLNIQHLHKGVYSLVVNHHGGVVSSKFIKN
jgi:hypothetical protein